MARLAISRAGLESPLRIGGDPSPENTTGGSQDRDAGDQLDAVRPKRVAAARATANAPAGDRAFLGAGRPVQTALRLELSVIERVGELATAAGVSANALVVAILEADAPRDLPGMVSMVRSQVEREREASAEFNLRLPTEMRVRLDELVRALPAAARVSRSQVVNAVLVDGLPSRAEDAADVVRRFRQRAAAASLEGGS